ncbi:DUF4998 domain-containing protein [Chitinophaga sp. 22321]|uniref:DUF5013 domain-containing protein n=1 Tax=Chitinophaga hostae TaxID=2831022 RepID=A0ABS5IZ76_9BACT|nr:DUF4998 domain-containing protein [Chitinophaga hostae]MBS0028200.1 DUF5013 domain-containing protein [Chitinophaga hostae]
MSRKVIFILPMLGGIFLAGCEKLDTEYRQYLNGKEEIYPGVPSDVSCNPGNKRVEFTWKPSPDPTVSKYVIYWNNYKDSSVLKVPDGKQSLFTGGIVGGFNEGTYFFVIRAFDNKNNKSVPLVVNNVSIYGDYYLSGLANRTVKSTELGADKTVKVTFNAPADGTNILTEIKYTSSSDKDEVARLLPGENLLSINNWKAGTSIVYRSAYKPVLNSLDTFYAKKYDTLVIKQDVTAQYLKNTAQPFLSVQSVNRFRDPAYWTVNAAVQNHNGMGGWGSDNNTVLCMESGWGSPDIVNGKMYQTTVLPAGAYSFEVELGSYEYGGNPVRLVAIEGTTLPDFSNDQVPGALGVADLALKNITFTVPQSGPVTLGFLVRMQGNLYWRVTKVRLLQHFM